MILVFFFPAFSQESGENEAVFIEVSEQDEVSDESTSETEEQDSDSEIDDFDSLFENAEDSEEPVVTEEHKAGTDYNVQLGTIKFPMEISGNMVAQVGGAYIRESMKNDATVYFDFKNYIYFTTRPDKYLALKGVLKSSLPKDSSDSESYNLLYLYELYFEYFMFNRIYFTAGQKKSVWGNIRLFSNDDDYSDGDALYTNVLYDSREKISGIVKVPFGNHTISALAMYKVNSESGNSPGTKDMSLAANAEFVIFSTSINFFGRRFPLGYGTNADEQELTVAGFELKRTILGFDIYSQTMGRMISGKKAIKNAFNSKFQDWSAFKRIITTAGIYRLWSDNAPYVGFNFEFQNIYHPEPSEDEKFFANRFAFYFGMSKLGPDRNIKIGLQWNHDLTNNSGLISPGIIFSGIMPHCDWQNGIKYEYDKDSTSFEKYKLTIGSYVTIHLDY